jgi:hypothetical protein
MTVSATSTPMARRRAIRRNIYKTPAPTGAQAHFRVGVAITSVTKLSPHARDDCNDFPPRTGLLR